MFTLTLVTPNKKLLTDVEIEDVILPGERGELNILPGHAPLVTRLHTGVLRYRLPGESEYRRAALSWGYCEVFPNGVMVLADTAELPQEIDKSRAERAFQEAQERLRMANLPVEETLKLQRKVQRAQVRLDSLT